MGYKEIVLTGIHTGGYGRDLVNYSLTDLLRDLLEQAPLIKRIRISSIEASEISDEMIDLIANNPKIARHLHIPLQSGSDPILKKMVRHYSTTKFYSIVEKLKAKVPSIAITTDVIVGFPSESEENFIETCEFIKKVGFSSLHVFPYSPRKGTPAASMSDQISAEDKKKE